MNHKFQSAAQPDATASDFADSEKNTEKIRVTKNQQKASRERFKIIIQSWEKRAKL